MLIHETTTDIRRAYARVLLNKLAAAAPTETGLPGRLVDLPGVPQQDYLLGLVDMLAFLGALDLSNDGLSIQPVSPQAGWLMLLLSDLIETQAPLVADWHSAGLMPVAETSHLFGRATNLLHALEQCRGYLLTNPAPIREVVAAIGILSRCEERGERRFLFVYDDDAGAWQLPGGRYEHTDVTTVATLFRELGEELGLVNLREHVDLTLHTLPLLTEIRESPTYGVLTKTLFHPFLVQLRDGLDLPASKSCWLREAELRADSTADGTPIAAKPLLRLLDDHSLNLKALFEHPDTTRPNGTVGAMREPPSPPASSP